VRRILRYPLRYLYQGQHRAGGGVLTGVHYAAFINGGALGPITAPTDVHTWSEAT